MAIYKEPIYWRYQSHIFMAYFFGLFFQGFPGRPRLLANFLVVIIILLKKITILLSLQNNIMYI